MKHDLSNLKEKLRQFSWYCKFNEHICTLGIIATVALILAIIK